MLIVRRKLKNTAFIVFSGFIYTDSTMVTMPKFILLKLVSSIRLIAKYNSDPSVLNRFFEYQKKIHLRTSSFIEICRFLVLFPEYRQKMYEQISTYSTKSAYNKFILFTFREILEQSNMKSLPIEDANKLELFYTKIISHSYLYWDARKNKKYFRAFFESFSCAYLIHELKFMINALMLHFPFNPSLHKYYGEMLLNIDGKFEGYKKEIMFIVNLEKTQSILFDPLVYEMALQNPKILQYINNGMTYNSLSSNDLYSLTSSSLFMKKKKKKVKNEEMKKKKSIASKIIRSKRKIPYLHIFHYILPTIFLLVFFIYSDQLSKKAIKDSTKLFNSMDVAQRSFYSVVSSIFILLSLRNTTFTDLTNESNCQLAFSNISLTINEYYSNSLFISDLSDSIFIFSFHEMANLVLKSNDVCYIVKHLNEYLIEKTYYNFMFIYEDNQHYLRFFAQLYENEKNLYQMGNFMLYGSIGIFTFIVIYLITACISLNTIMRKNQRAIDYLSSEKRLSHIFQKPEKRDNLWYLCNEAENSLNSYDSTLRLEYESEADSTKRASSSSVYQKDLYNPKYFDTPKTKPDRNNSRIVSSSVHLMDQISDSPSNMKSKDSECFDTSTVDRLYSDNKKKKLKISNSQLSGSVTNIRPNSQMFIPKNTTHFAKSNDDVDDSLIIDSTANASTVTSSTKYNENDSDFPSNQIQLNSFDSNHNNSNISIEEKNEFLRERKNETWKYSLYSIIITILLPWIIVYILAFLGYFPLASRKDHDFYNGLHIYYIARDYSDVLLLLNETLKLYYDNEMNASKYIKVYQDFNLNLTDLSKVYFEKKCFNFGRIECFSVHDVAQKIINDGDNKTFLETLALPMFMNFTDCALKVMYSMTHSDLFELSSSSYSFIALVIVMGIMFAFIGYINSKSLMNGLNSLFHFPGSEIQIVSGTSKSSQTQNNEENINQATDSNTNIDSINSTTNDNTNNNNNKNTEENDNKLILTNKKFETGNLSRFPTNIIMITSVTDTDEIYSISETCLQIINKKPSDLICRKFSRIFPKSNKTGNFDIREHNGKKFISKTKTIGKLSKTVLIETSKAESKNKATNVVQKLINFMPYYFVKQFSDEFINFFHFDRSLLICVRINANVPLIENFFTIISRIDQSFSNIEFIRSNGSIITFICSNLDLLEIVLFLRDLIQSSEESCKKQMNNLALKSVFIDMIDQLNIEIINGSVEPETSFEERMFFELESKVFYVDDHCIGFSDEVFTLICSKIKVEEIISRNKIHQIPYKAFMDQIADVYCF